MIQLCLLVNYFARFSFRPYKFVPYFSPRERCPDRELGPAAAGAAFLAAAAAAPPAAAEQELGRVRGRLRRRRLRLRLRLRHGAATAERQGKDHHGAHPRQRK